MEMKVLLLGGFEMLLELSEIIVELSEVVFELTVLFGLVD